MQLSDLPLQVDPVPGEIVHSWLDRIRHELALPEDHWWAWCGCSATEPERRADGRNWVGLPVVLGRIAEVPPSWRIAPRFRSRYCPDCQVPSAGGARHPILVEWLDARVIACDRHRRLLSPMPGSVTLPLDAVAEIESLHQWLRCWRRSDVDLNQLRLRRDLVLTAGRNWSVVSGGTISSELRWTLGQMGIPEGGRGLDYPAHGPARLGELGHPERTAALLGAYRAWRALEGVELECLPRWPVSAWTWLGRRCRARGQLSMADRIDWIVRQFTLNPRQRHSGGM